MSMDIRLVEAMVSRICHDLISPIAAVNNGTELIADLGEVQSGDGAFSLIQDSAEAASIKLQAFRLAYGAGGSEWHVSIDDVEKAFGDLISLEKRHTLAWDVDRNAMPSQLKKGFPKVLMLTLMWALECLPKGGQVAISYDANLSSFAVSAEGEGAGLKEGADQAFDGSLDVEKISPKLIHAAALGYYAKHYEIDLVHSSQGDVATFRVSEG